MPESSRIFYGETHSQVGPLTIAVKEKELYKIEFGGVKQTLAPLQSWVKKHFPNSVLTRDDEQIAPVVAQLYEYFKGDRRSFDLPLGFKGTDFQKRVWEALRDIPYGQTRTYKDIAESIGSPKAVRAVGNANNKNPLSIIVPCHRVIGSSGSLVGYGGGLDRKAYLLDLEQEQSMKKTASL